MSTLGYGLGVTAVGIMIVFAGLIIIIAVISLLKRLSHQKNRTESNIPVLGVEKPVHSVSAFVREEDAVTVAVIAAVAAVMMNENAENRYTVRRIRRVSNAPAWQRAGREDQIYSRL